MGLPPTHRIDHTPVCVLTHDSAWDQERIDYEYSVLGGAEADETRPVIGVERLEDHPVWRYRTGESRGDLETVRAYLRDEEQPVRFVLRRLGLREWATMQNMISSSTFMARIYAISHALVRVDGCELKLSRGGSDAGRLSDADVNALRELCGDAGFMELTGMAMSVSAHITSAEKKR